MEVGALWVKLGLDKAQYDKDVNSTKSSGQGLSNFLKNAFSFTLGQGMFDLLKTGIRSAWDASIGYNSVMQQNQIAFESMLGSADKAGAILQKLGDMAAATPFEFPELADAAKKLLAFGFNAQVIPGMLTKIGDAAAGLGMGSDGVQRLILAIGQMRAKAKISAGEMMQLTEAGVPAWDILAKAMGKSTAEVMELSEKGLIPADKAINQLVDGMESRFPGMMSKQSASFSGLMSTLKDNINSTFGAVFKPAFDWLSAAALPGAIAGVEAFKDSIDKGAPVFVAFREGLRAMIGKDNADIILNVTDKITGLGLALKGAITGDEESLWIGLTEWMGLPAGAAEVLTTGLMGLHDAAASALGWIADNGPIVKSVIVGITGAFVAHKIAVLGSIATQEIHNGLLLLSALRSGGLAAAKTALAAAEGSATVAQWAFNAAMNANPLGIIIMLVAGLVAALVYLWNTNEGFRNAVINAWNMISAAAVALFTQIKDWIVNNWLYIQQQTAATWQAISSAITGFFTEIWDAAVNFATGIFDAIAAGWNKIVSTTTAVWTAIKNFFSFWWQTILVVFGGPLGWLIVYVYQHWTEIKNKTSEVFNAIASFFTSIWTSITSFLTERWRNLSANAAALWELIRTYIVNPISAAINYAIGIFNSFNSFLVGIWSSVGNAAASAWNGIKNTITGKIQEIKGAASNIAGQISDSVAGAWDSLKGRASNIFNGIKDTIVGVFRNIKIPVPHFNLGTKTKSLAGVSFPVPDIDIDWYAKGGIFNGPQVVGVGEAGQEAVLPIAKLSGILADTMAKMGIVNNSQQYAAAAGIAGIVIQQMIVREDKDIKEIAKELYRLQQEDARRRGKK